mgnify:FL=1
MWHIFKNSKGEFEVAFVTKGRYQVGSNQGYARKSGAIAVLKSVLKAVESVTREIEMKTACLLWQDDTLEVPKTYWLFKYDRGCEADVKPVKKYVPQKKVIRKTTSFV